MGTGLYRFDKPLDAIAAETDPRTLCNVAQTAVGVIGFNRGRIMVARPADPATLKALQDPSLNCSGSERLR
jgi:hypothetical protein